MCSQVQKLYLATGNDRLKLLVLYSGEEDERLRKAAAGTLAMLSGEQPELCARIPGTVRTPSSVQHSQGFKVIFIFLLTCQYYLSTDDPLARDRTVIVA